MWHCFLWYTIPVLDDVAHLQYCAILFKNHTRGKTIYKQLSVKIDIHIKIKKIRMTYTHYNVNEVCVCDDFTLVENKNFKK